MGDEREHHCAHVHMGLLHRLLVRSGGVALLPFVMHVNSHGLGLGTPYYLDTYCTSTSSISNFSGPISFLGTTHSQFGGHCKRWWIDI